MVEEIIKEAGWYKDRKVDISDYKRVLLEEKYLLTYVSEMFLKEYGGLVIKFDNPKISGDILILEINPIEAARTVFRSVSERYEKYCNERFVIIGEIKKEDMSLYITESGAFYGGYDDCLLKLGDNFYQAVENLTQGIKTDLIVVED